eukprot:5019943-Prymnesium_polylepis.1
MASAAVTAEVSVGAAMEMTGTLCRRRHSEQASAQLLRVGTQRHRPPGKFRSTSRWHLWRAAVDEHQHAASTLGRGQPLSACSFAIRTLACLRGALLDSHRRRAPSAGVGIVLAADRADGKP